MAIRLIVKKGEEALTKVCRTVDKFDERLHLLLDDMADTMYNADGVGLAAPQIGILKRIVVIDIGDGLVEMINPKIVEADGVQEEIEGCLSVPGVYVLTKRPYKVKATAFDRNGNLFEIEAEDFMARAICHELDHLDGHLMLERGRVLSDEELREMMSDGEDNE